MKKLTLVEVILKLRDMDAQLICHGNGDTIFKQAAEYLESKCDYSALAQGIKDAPMTWLPALLATAVEAARDKKVFKSDKHLLTFVDKASRRAEEARISIKNSK